MLDPSFFAGNRSRLFDLLDSDALVILTAQGLQQRSNDSAYDFRQDSSFFYITGSNQPNALWVGDTKTREHFLILPKQTEVEEYFGGIHNCDKIAEETGVKQIYNYYEGWKKVKELQKSCKKVYTFMAPPVQFTRQERMYSNPARRLLLQKIKHTIPLPLEFINTQLAELRSVKQPAEVKALQAAIDLTAEGITNLRRALKPGVYEYELEAELDYTFKRRGHKHGFMPPIIASGKNATILHYQQNSAQVKNNDFLLIDLGAEVSNYGADISRTYKVGTKFTRREQSVFEAVMYVHLAAIALLKPGLSWRDYSIEVDKVMGEELMKLGLITMNSREAVREYFPHAISHSLGLDTHDVYDYSKAMQIGNVITVEPGIYIPDEGTGVRIEDDILITKTGAKNLSEHIPYV